MIEYILIYFALATVLTTSAASGVHFKNGGFFAEIDKSILTLFFFVWPLGLALIATMSIFDILFKMAELISNKISKWTKK